MADDVDTVLPSGIATIRARLLALDDAHAKGALDDATYANARREAERALTDAVLAAPIDAVAPKRVARPSTRLLVALSVVVLVVAAGGYVLTGSPSLAGRPVAAGAAPGTAADADQIGPQQIAAMVDKLAARLKDKPDDAEGWTMLARSYVVLGRYREALPAYQQALRLQPRNADLMADYADAVAAATDGPGNAESTALVARALAIDPAQPKALALSGTVAFDRGDYAMAVAQWQKIVDTLPPGGEFRKQVMTNIDEARTRGGLPAPVATAPSVASSTPSSAAPSAPPSAPSSKAPPVANATPGHEALTGIVSLDPALAAAVAPTDTVFVLARPESGRMPLAVFRATVKDLPLRFRLDDSMAMTPTMKLSDMKQVIVAARVSKSGNAISQPGDLSGESGLVAPGTKDLAIVIGGVARPR